MKLNDEKGIALIMTLFVVIILFGFSTMFVLRTIHESVMVKKELAITRSFYIAEGGNNAALEGLDNLINNFLLNTVNGTNPSVLISKSSGYVTSNDGLGFLVEMAADNGTPVLTLNGAQAEFDGTGNLGSGSYTYDIVITEKSNPVAATSDSWDFPYNYQVFSSGSADNVNQRLLLSGDFTVRVQRDNFAKYALFTNNQQTPGGANVWFSDKTNFAGPLHTNGRYNIYGNPSGTFDGLVEQVEELTRYYNSGAPVLLNADFNGTSDVPVFNAGFNRDVDPITLSSPSQKQDVIDQATGGQSYGSDGIYVSETSGNLTGGIYVKGNGTISMNVVSGNASYTINQGATTKIITVDRVNNQTSVETVGVGTSVYNGLPDGLDNVGTVIHVDGKITSLQGTVQRDTGVTISSSDDIVIQNNVEYENYTHAVGNPGDAYYAPPTADGTDNILGIVSWGGDVEIGTSAPDNVNVHGTILAKSGIFTVKNYNDWGVGSRGTATLLGGVISDNYGAFGQFNGSTGEQGSGYGRNFVYDERMQSGSAPPYFPTLNTFVAFTNDITDKMIWQENEI